MRQKVWSVSSAHLSRQRMHKKKTKKIASPSNSVLLNFTPLFHLVFGAHGGCGRFNLGLTDNLSNVSFISLVVRRGEAAQAKDRGKARQQ